MDIRKIGILLFLKVDWSSDSIFLIDQNILKKYKCQVIDKK